MQHRMRVGALVLALAVVAGGLEGCASDKVRVNAYKMLGSYAVAVETAADVAENPLTSNEVVHGIKEAKDIASPVVKLLYQNARAYADLQDQIQGIRDAGGEPDIALLNQVNAALIALQKSMADTAPLIAQLLAAVRSV
jgi:hypothetical protein